MRRKELRSSPCREAVMGGVLQSKGGPRFKLGVGF